MYAPHVVHHYYAIITAGHLSPPNKLFINSANFVSRRLTFSWSPVAPDCPDIHYIILASTCGSCPTTTNHTNVTCTDVPTENSVCTFAIIQTVLCGSLVGDKSDPVIVTTTRAEAIIKGWYVSYNCTADIIILNLVLKHADSLSTLILGGLMLFLAVVLITGCILYAILMKPLKICSQ